MTHTYSLQEIARLPAPKDNAAIATRMLERGTYIKFNDSGFVLNADVLEGHRFAVRPIAEGQVLLSWGMKFGVATRDIAPGNYVVNAQTLDALRERQVKLNLPEQPNFRNQIEPYQFDETKFKPGEQVERYAESKYFMGYRRDGGRGVGTRNMIVILGISSRAASYARALALRTQNLRVGFENIDGIAAVAHTEGSGDDPINNYDLLLRTLAGLIIHPNVGAVLAVDYPGDPVTQRELRAYMTEHHYSLENIPHDWLTLEGNFENDLTRGAEIVRAWLPQVNQTTRTQESIAQLKIALQCGGSDAFSGVSGNPLVGAVTSEIVRYGGSGNLAETDELVGAEAYILRNVRDLATAHAFLNMIERFQEQLAWHGVSAEGNPSGGNRFRGLYNISLKSLGAAMKKDPAVRIDRVIDYGERMNEAGFYFMNSPGNDLESVAGQVAAGCNMIFFTTGNGSITNFPFVPTIKIMTTTGRYNLLSNEMDVNAGAYLDGEPFDQLTNETLELAIRVASGELSKGERAAHSQISIWRNWRQTDARRVNVLLQMPAPNGEPLPLRPADSPVEPIPFPNHPRKSIGLILPTSLCASQIARLAANELNLKGMGQPEPLSRFVALTHTEGCGVSGDSYFAMYKRTMVNYMMHPMVRYGLFMEHGCEITHNDSMLLRLKELGIDPNQFGWTSIQRDGGIEKVLAKAEDWFAARLANGESSSQNVETMRIGLMCASTPPQQVSAALASLTRAIVRGSGTLVMPSTSPLLKDEAFKPDLLGEQKANSTLAYGQFAAQQGLHIMDAPSTHWVETITGLGATGVELILAYVGAMPISAATQAHPFIPTLQFSYVENVANMSDEDLDLVLSGNAKECARELETALRAALEGELKLRAAEQGNSDFQITRALLGVSV